MRIADRIKQAEDTGAPYYSFEFFPPKTEQGLTNLYDRIERMGRAGPGFVAVTWGAGGATAQRTVELCGACQGVFGLDTLMHVTCTNMDRAMVDAALAGAKTAGVRNLLALRGDAPRGDEYWAARDGGFRHAIDLVKYIRASYGDYFCIGVAGYPEGHSESADQDQDLEYLREKVEAGADFVVSQLVYDADVFVAWRRRCRERGIAVPIVAGVLPVQSYQSFCRLVHLTGVGVPDDFRRSLDAVRANDQAVKDLGVRHAVDLIRRLHGAGVWAVHLTTLNLETTVMRVLGELGQGPTKPSTGAAAGTAGPGGAVAGGAVGQLAWDDFPNGRWGDARSPAFGDGSSAYGSAALHVDGAWGTPTSEADITRLFVGYVRGGVKSLPWSEDGPLRAETAGIRAQLARVNALGFWTVASQPAVDGARSDDPAVGWGPKGGYVYQKAFVECWVSARLFPPFLSRLQSSTRVTYYAANRAGDFVSNAVSCDAGENAAVLTWGVFPGRAIVQPTLIDKMNFFAWRADAFRVWADWAAALPPPAARFLDDTAAACWLVTVVDNDYKRPDAIWDMFE
ncbi:methylenetetrahydrofolate reductase 1 [Coemansia sp. RSA 2322]|nr:methylenetetrahydrofolate reductase 1 [Coemansia sp. RSA 2322]